MKGFLRLVRLRVAKGEDRAVVHSCIPGETIERFIVGEATAAEGHRLQEHAGHCATCRETLLALGLGLGKGSLDEEALVAERMSATTSAEIVARLGIEEKRGAQVLAFPSARARSTRWVAAAAAIAACLALIFVLPGGGEQSLPWRSLQGRPAALEQHAPWTSTRGTGEANWDERSLSSARRTGPGAERAWLLARGGIGDWERVAQMLDHTPASGPAANDRGVLLLAQGKVHEALTAFDEALRQEPSLVAARFNRALALEALGRWDEARAAWQDYLEHAGEDDEGWRREAESYLRRGDP